MFSSLCHKNRPLLSKKQRGFIHVLLLVFFVLSVSIWGVSEIFFRAIEKQQQAQRAGASALQAAKEALLHYATAPPPRVNLEEASGSYNSSTVPFRRFVLPCPDLIGGDNNLDGAADFNCADDANPATAYRPLQSGSRFGRLPWRDDLASGVRGVGNRDFRGSRGERLWYILSNNVASGNVSTNPHTMLRLTSGWLSLMEDGELISDRIAAIIIAPGAAESAVVSEDLLFNGATAATLVSATHVDAFSDAYLDATTYLQLTTSALLVSIRTDSTLRANSSAADRLVYLTIDELAVGAGIDLVSGSDGSLEENNIYSLLDSVDSVDSGGGFLGVSDLLQVYLNRHGYLPEPVMFSEQSALRRGRRSGPLGGDGQVEAAIMGQLKNLPSNAHDDLIVDYEDETIQSPYEFYQFPLSGQNGHKLENRSISNNGAFRLVGAYYPVTRASAGSSSVNVFVEGQRSAFVSVATSLPSPTVMVPMAGLPPVYLISSVTINLSRSTQLNALPPYNVILANLDTGLNEAPLDNAAVNTLAAAGHYPTDGLFGVYGSSALSLFSTDDTNLVPNLVINQIAPITLQSGGLFTVALAAPAYGYFQGSSLISIVHYLEGSGSDVSLLPPYGGRVLLPAGTKLPLDSRSVAINLPAGYSARGSFNPANGSYALAPTDQPIVITPSDVNYVVEVPHAIPNHWPVVAGDFGFFPVNHRPVNNVSTAVSVLLGVGGAVSHLPVDIGLYTEARLTLIPFPPPGRPGSLDILMVTLTNTINLTPLTVSLQTVTQLNTDIAAVASPLFIPEYAEFSLPANARVLYPNGGIFNTGVDFAFPQGAVAYFPPGAVINVAAPINTIMPDGRGLKNAALQTVEVVLHHGGALGLANARAVLKDGFASGTGQELFDIELRSEAAVVSVGIFNVTAVVVTGTLTSTVVNAVTNTVFTVTSTVVNAVVTNTVFTVTSTVVNTVVNTVFTSLTTFTPGVGFITVINSTKMTIVSSVTMTTSLSPPTTNTVFASVTMTTSLSPPTTNTVFVSVTVTTSLTVPIMTTTLTNEITVSTLPANAILQPYTGRAIDQVGPIQLPEQTKLFSPSYIRAGFLTRERYNVHHIDRTISSGGGVRPLLISNLAVLLPPDINITTSSFSGGENLNTVTLAAEFDENSSFLLPPNQTISILYTRLHDGTPVSVNPIIVFPPGTGLYDSDIEPQLNLSTFQLRPPVMVFSTAEVTVDLVNNISVLNASLAVNRAVAVSGAIIVSAIIISLFREWATPQQINIENSSLLRWRPGHATGGSYILALFRDTHVDLSLTVNAFPGADDIINVPNVSLNIPPGTSRRHQGHQQFYYEQVTVNNNSYAQRVTTGYRKNSFALFLDNDIRANSPQGNAVLAAGGVVDVVNGHYWPPSGVQKLRRIADDLQLVSFGEMQIHLPARTALRMDFDQLEILNASGNPSVAVAVSATASVVLQYVQYPSLGVVGNNATAVYSQLTVQTSLSLPPNAIILVPRGQPLDFLSEYPAAFGDGFEFTPEASLYAETADYAHLPSGAVAVIPPGEEFYYATTVGAITNTINLDIPALSISATLVSFTLAGITMTFTRTDFTTLDITAFLAITVESPTIISLMTMTGPGYLRLDGLSGGRAAFVNHPSHMPTPPLVFLSEAGNLIHGNVSPVFQENIYARVPKNSRLDMLGYMETRADNGVFANILPPDYSALLRDFPLGYAVAPECRRQAVSAGSKCGDGPGLSFEVPAGEEIALSEGMAAPSGMLLTVTHSDGRLRVISQSLAEFVNGAPPATTATVAAVLVNDSSGLVSFSGGGTTPNIGDVLRIELVPHHSATAMRAYLGNLNFSSPLNDIHYADIDGVLTVHVGGFIGDKHGAAAGAITLSNGFTLFLGVGAPLRGGVNGQKIFGQGSYASVALNGTVVGLPIEDYSIIDALSYSAVGTLAMVATEVDAFGGVFSTLYPYEQVSVSGVGGVILTGAAVQPPLKTAVNAFIKMDPGYLWQGYIPPGGTLTFTENTQISRYNGLSPNAYLRVQPTVRALNFFATGQERPEGLDGRGPAAAGSITFNAPPQDVYAGAVLSVRSEYREEDQLVPNVFTGVRGLSQVTWPGPWRFTFQRPVNTPIIGEQLAGVNTVTLTTPRQTVNLTSTVVYDAGGTTISATVTVYQDDAITVSLIIDITNTTLSVTIQSTMMTVIPASTATFNAAAIAGKTEFTAGINRYIVSATVELIDTHPGGFARANVLFTNTVLAGALSQLTLYARVRDNSGMRTVTATWNAPPLVWNRYSNPFSATAYASRFDYGTGYDLWALPDLDDLSGNSDPGYLNNFMCNGVAATAYFNPPPYQMAASLIAPPAAWAFNVAGANYQGLTLALPIDGIGGSISLAVQRTPDYVPLSVPPSYLAISTTLPISVNLAGAPKQAVSYSDLVFYMDTSYNKNLGFRTVVAFITNYAVIPHVTGTVTNIINIPLADLPPPQTLYFGDDFNIQGPGAIVPPFGGHNTVAVADVYASRSKLFSDLFGYPALHTIYDEMTGDCVGTDDCAAMFNSSDWIPIVGGAIALGGVNVSVASGGVSPRLIMPQPQALVEDENGNTVTIYAGSMLLPTENLIYPAVKLDKDYVLQIGGAGGVAAIDVNPAAAPRPVLISRVPYTTDQKEVVLNEDFNFSPVTVNSTADCIVEPLFFDKDVIYNNFEFNEGKNVISGVVTTLSITAFYQVRNTINEITRYDGSFGRGFLLNEQGASLVADYYAGKSIYTGAHGFSPANLYDEFPRYNNDHPLGNPLSYHWTVPGTHFLPMGGEKSSTLTTFSAAGLSVTTYNGQFSALRLAHKIDIPRTAISIRAYQDAVRYPDTTGNMFQFPSGSQAMAVNVDAGSWESIHPYLGLQAKGLKVVVMTVSAAVTTIVGSLTVGAHDDSFVATNIGDKRLLHYQRAESLPGDRVFSAAEIYNNVWIRLPDGGQLVAADGDIIYLPPDSIINPLLGTYLPGDIFTAPGGAAESKLQNDYLTRVVLNSTIEITRPAYVLPKGSRLVVASVGARINNVKAALFFSLTPKDGVSCPYGDWRLGGEQQQRVVISQTREGVSENLYGAVSGGAIVNAGHPCAWFDDPENTDGDRIFLYRGRRRHYASDLRVREVSNDRTYTLGGQLVLN